MLATAQLTDHTQLLETLNTLLSFCKDGQQGFADAAENSSTSRVKSFMHKQEQNRSKLSLELIKLIEDYGGQADDSGSLIGSLHRVWLATKDIMTSRDDDALIQECIRGEEAALEAYENALESTLPFDVHEKIKHQKEQLETVKNELQELLASPARVS